MRTPELKTTILKMVGGREFYGYEIHKELEQSKIKIGIGRLYSILAEMKDDGLLKDRWEKSQTGPKRRTYRIGRKGSKEREKILMDAIRTVHDFYTEYLLSLPPEHSVFAIVSRILTEDLTKTSNIGYAASRFPGPLRKIIGQLRTVVPDGNVYAISHQAKELDLGFEDVFVIEGTFEDLPMKDDHLDLLIVTGNIKSDCLDACLSEWRRVLAKEGILAIITPTATITSYEDPLEIGEFIEQREHPRLEDKDTLNSDILRAEMGRYFKSVEEEKVVHITLLLGKKIV
ncbi:MAG: helix-turn-helix transcriptional regulator [Candidatus Thorarchaeota archaeon]|jgi:DNA-binding PadR family transcriptional regulator